MAAFADNVLQFHAFRLAQLDDVLFLRHGILHFCRVYPIFAYLFGGTLVRGADGRYHIHQLLRQYGEEKLRTSPEAYAAAREAHLAYYAAFAARRADELRGNKFYEAIAALGVELDNLLVTWEWACEHPQHHEVLWDFVFCFNWFFWEENRWHEGLLIPLAAIPVVEHSGAPAILAYLVTWYGALMCATFREGGEETLRRGVALLDGLADADLCRELADLMVMAGWTHGGLQNFDELRHLSQRAIAIAREYQWEWETAFAVLLYAAAYFNNWFTDSELEVRLLLKEITDIAQAIGNMWLLNARGLLLGSLEQQEGNLVEAKRLYLQILPYISDVANRGHTLASLALIALKQGNYIEAQDWCRQHIYLLHQSDLRFNWRMTLFRAADVLAILGEYERAAAIIACLKNHSGQQAYEGLVRFGSAYPLDELADKLAPEAYAAALARGHATDPEDMLTGLLAFFTENRENAKSDSPQGWGVAGWAWRSWRVRILLLITLMTYSAALVHVSLYSRP